MLLEEETLLLMKPTTILPLTRVTSAVKIFTKLSLLILLHHPLHVRFTLHCYQTSPISSHKPSPNHQHHHQTVIPSASAQPSFPISTLSFSPSTDNVNNTHTNSSLTPK
ncbi:unnamed protein product [Vicia faba]|uniref:Uncharacterized protein n=1 Tax=Vicia faba TaxID=3906 RepID=A0AAV0Z967_VICFA|nr:unnamed protein product [Vicia faba]